VRHVSDAFLLNMAEVSATLIGLFLVGVFHYVDTDLRRSSQMRDVFDPYLRAGTRITLIAFAIPIGVSMALVTLELVWARVVFAAISVVLVLANIDSLSRVRGVASATGSTALLVNEVAATALTLVLIVAPWVLGGLRPSRGDLTWSILLAFAAGFLSIGAVVLSTFDIARLERRVAAEGNDPEA
jgi:hypothetical protein